MSKVKKVYKYGTGQAIPEGAIYLSTQAETKKTIKDLKPEYNTLVEIKENLFVWHYFLVEVSED